MSKGLRHVAALFVALLLAFFVITKVTGCWDKVEYPDHEPIVTGGPTAEDRPHLKTVNEFTFRLARELEFEGNALVSPLSLYQNLALLMNGAEGDTKVALEAVLGTSQVVRQDLNDAQNRLINRYREMEDRPVRLANGLFFVWPIVLSKGTVTGYEQWYNADIVKLGSAGVGAVREINLWASEQTDGMIPHIVDKLDKEQIMLVLNALAFDADWDVPFERKMTQQAAFHTPDGDVNVPTMQRSGGVEGKIEERYTAARLEYKGGELAMTIVMPDEGLSPAEWLTGLDDGAWDAISDGWYDHEGAIYLPKFSFDEQIDLIPAVRALGGGALFDEPNDFRHISSDLVGRSTISRIEQYTYIEVDEKGTKAAAVTDSEASTGSAAPGEEIRIDRPFVFFVHDLETDVILFFGIVNDPSQ